MSYVHGIATTMSGISGYAQSISFDQSSKEAALEDAFGETVAVEYFDTTVDCKAELKFETTESPIEIEIGDIITISGAKFSNHNGAYALTKIGESQSNKDYASFSVEMKRYLANGVPTAQASASA